MTAHEQRGPKSQRVKFGEFKAFRQIRQSLASPKFRAIWYLKLKNLKTE